MKLFSPFDARHGIGPEYQCPDFLCPFFCDKMIKGFIKPHTIFSCTIALIMICTGSLSAGQGIYSDIEILDQSASELVLKYTAGEISLIEADNYNCRIPFVKGCIASEKENLPPLPVKTLVIGVPHETELSYDIVSVSWGNEYSLNCESKSGLWDKNTNLIEPGRRSKIRSQSTQSVNLNPYRINNRTVQILDEAVIRFSFSYSETQKQNSGYGFRDEGSFENILSGLLVNYQQARNWREIKTESLALDAKENLFGLYSDWLKITVSSTGVQKITADDLISSGIDIETIDPRNIRLFWAGGKPVEVSVEEPRAELKEMAILVEGEADGSFDPSDFIVFYLPSAQFYDYDSITGEVEYINNPYTRESVAYLTCSSGGAVSPKRITTSDVTPDGSGSEVFSFSEFKHFEQNEFLSVSGDYIFDFYYWYWVNDISFEHFINIDGLTGSDLSKLTLVVAGRSPIVTINGFEPDSTEIYNDVQRSRGVYYSDAFSSGLNRLNIIISPALELSLLDYIELNYKRRLQYAGGTFAFNGKMQSGKYDYIITSINTDSAYTLLDITNLYEQKLLTGYITEPASGMMSFEYSYPENQFSRFALVQNFSMSTPENIETVEVENIIDPGESHDIIVVTPKQFLPAFEDYKSLVDDDGYSVYLTAVEDVYAHFSGGMFDPLAIRDFFKYAYENWQSPAPAFALLGGDGCYDFLNHTGNTKPNYIPPYIAPDDSSVSDEKFIVFDPEGLLDSDNSYPEDRGPDMVISRWPVRTQNEISLFIDKLAGYNSRSDAGKWQNLITFVADDERKPRSVIKETFHTNQSENLANDFTPDKYDVNKIYLIEYPLDSRGEKPGARQKLIESINSGTVFVNFIGHGNPRLWTDERIFRNEDISSLNNQDRLTVVFTASCSIGEFDSPFDESMAELMFRYNDGGAIAIVAATRLVFSTPNASYNYRTFEVLFTDEDYSLAEIIYISKFLKQQTSGVDDNDSKYILFGDPVMRIAFPDYNISFNDDNLDSLKALDLVTIEGEIVDQEDNRLTGFNGTAEVVVYDNELDKKYTVPESILEIDYKMPGAGIYRGETNVTAGEFSLQFIVPKDISYGGSNARVSAFARSETTTLSASGSRDSIQISGSVAVISDTLPPEVTVLYEDQELSDGLLITQNSNLTVELFDSSGINLSGEVGHRFELSLDEDPFYTYDLTNNFKYYPDSYRKGSAVFQIPEVENGNYKLTIKAWDSANNSVLKEFDISIGAVEATRITEFFNVPNPFSENTQFYYILTNTASNVNIDIFTLNGRKIHTIDGLEGNSGENISNLWDGTDRWGDKLANGIYIYKLSVTTESENTDKKLEKYGKLVILR